VRTNYNDSTPANSTKSVVYGEQELFRSTWRRLEYDMPLYESLCATFEGFIRPPYSGMFKIFVAADDSAQLWFGNCSSDLVW
jgi:hypothetical protein